VPTRSLGCIDHVDILDAAPGQDDPTLQSGRAGTDHEDT
jgi:hypothetical protein